MSTIIVSVVIPVYKEPRLEQCLAALTQQTLPKHLFEVIIVNNDPDTPLQIDPRLDLQLVLLDEKTPGSYAARNAGIKSARGAYIAFTDADCTPGSTWLKAGVELFKKSPEVDAISGKIVQYQLEPPISDALYHYLKAHSFNHARYARKGVAATGNFFVKLSVAMELNGFDATLLSGGDFDFCQRLRAHSYTLIYDTNVIVNHPVRRLLESIQRHRRLTGGSYYRGVLPDLTLVSFLRGLCPPISFMLPTYEGLSTTTLIRLYLITWLFKVTRTIERALLILGKSPRRI